MDEYKERGGSGRGGSVKNGRVKNGYKWGESCTGWLAGWFRLAEEEENRDYLKSVLPLYSPLNRWSAAFKRRKKKERNRGDSQNEAEKKRRSHFAPCRTPQVRLPQRHRQPFSYHRQLRHFLLPFLLLWDLLYCSCTLGVHTLFPPLQKCHYCPIEWTSLPISVCLLLCRTLSCCGVLLLDNCICNFGAILLSLVPSSLSFSSFSLLILPFALHCLLRTVHTALKALKAHWI